jgi:hypothetical protein
MPIRAPPCATAGPAPAWTGTRPTSSLPSLPERQGNQSSIGSGLAGRAAGQAANALTGRFMAGELACASALRRVAALAVSGRTPELYGFELEPEVRDWLDSLSDSDYKRVGEVCGMLAEKGTRTRRAMGGPP